MTVLPGRPQPSACPARQRRPPRLVASPTGAGDHAQRRVAGGSSGDPTAARETPRTPRRRKRWATTAGGARVNGYRVDGVPVDGFPKPRRQRPDPPATATRAGDGRVSTAQPYLLMSASGGEILRAGIIEAEKPENTTSATGLDETLAGPQVQPGFIGRRSACAYNKPNRQGDGPCANSLGLL